MPYQRMKSEDYAQIDGLDRRSAFFVGDRPRCLELQNMTYQRPGSYVPRPGSEYDSFSGYSNGVSLAISEVFFLKEAKYGVASSLAMRTYLFGTEQGLYVQSQGGTQVVVRTPPTASNQGTPNPWTSAEFIRTFAANGTYFICVNVEDSPNTPRYYDVFNGGISPPLPGNNLLYATYSGGASAWVGATGLAKYVVTSGFFNVNDGLFAPPLLSTFVGVTATTGPINIHANFATGSVTAPFGYTGPAAAFLFRQQGTDTNYYLLGSLNTTFNGTSFVSYVDYGSRTDTIAAGASFQFIPRVVTEFNNALFCANLYPLTPGVYAPESTVAYSALGKPASFGATQTFQVGTDSSEPILGMFSWNSQLLIGKRRSLYVLTGTDARTYQLRQISKTIGVVGPNAFAEYAGGKRLGIINDNGVASWDGASLDEDFSTKIYDAFVPSPGIYSSAGTWPARKESWFSLSRATLGTSELNPPRSRIVAFDYLVNQWWEGSTYPGNCIAFIPQTNLASSTPPAMYFGGSSNMVFRHVATSVNDLTGLAGINAGSGNPFTCVIATAFKDELGKSVEKVYRRLRTDISLNQGATGAGAGSTLLVTAQFRVDGQTAIVLSRTFNAGITGPSKSPGSWLNFGISAKQLAVRWFFQNVGNPTFSIVFNGYTFESRYQRNT